MRQKIESASTIPLCTRKKASSLTKIFLYMLHLYEYFFVSSSYMVHPLFLSLSLPLLHPPSLPLSLSPSLCPSFSLSLPLLLPPSLPLSLSPSLCPSFSLTHSLCPSLPPSLPPSLSPSLPSSHQVYILKPPQAAGYCQQLEGERCGRAETEVLEESRIDDKVKSHWK